MKGNEGIVRNVGQHVGSALAGDPLANLELVADPPRNFVVVMKDGVIYENGL